MGWYTSSTVGFHLLMFPPQLSYSHPKTWQFRPAIGENASASNCLPFSHRETSSSSSLKYSFLSCCRTKFKFTSGEVGRYEMIYTCIYIYQPSSPHPPPPRASCKFHASTMHPDPRRQIRIWWSWSCQSYPRGGSEKIIPPTWPSNL